MFSYIYDNLKYSKFKKNIDINFILDKARNLDFLNNEEILTLINQDIDLELLKKTASYLSQLRFGRTIKLYTPLYYSNECINSCSYCGFNKDNKIKRITLSLDEIYNEAKIISDQGIEHILLVAGENNNINLLESILLKIKPLFSSILIEVAPLSYEAYKKLYSLGVNGVISYQETYNKKLYDLYHLAGPKKNFINRLNTLDKAGEAKIRILGIGSLLGLNDYKEELFYLIQHALYLQKKYWQSQINISFPRIKSSNSNFKILEPLSDEKLLKMIAILRIILPDANLVLSTRESITFRNLSLAYGITQFSAGSKTSPLGYSTNNYSEQFSISDNRSINDLKNYLKNNNYEPVFKDWDREFVNE